MKPVGLSNSPRRDAVIAAEAVHGLPRLDGVIGSADRLWRSVVRNPQALAGVNPTTVIQAVGPANRPGINPIVAANRK